MKNTLKILAILPLFVLSACNDKTYELTEDEARTQVASMKEEINKDTFNVPTKGTAETIMTLTQGNSTLNTENHVVFDTSLGSRYIYVKTLSMLSVEIYLYEKDGKYYQYYYSIGASNYKEYETQEEFASDFSALTKSYSVDSESIKNVAITYLDNITTFYDSLKNSNDNTTSNSVDNVKFTKINDSSFKFELNSNDSTKVSENDEVYNYLSLEYENYLPKRIDVSTNSTINDIATKTEGSQTYNWGKINYTYPSTK